MDSLYVICVVLTLQSKSVCWTEPSEQVCVQALGDWLDRAYRWTKTSPGAGPTPVAGCMSWEYFIEMDKPLFSIENKIPKLGPVENVK